MGNLSTYGGFDVTGISDAEATFYWVGNNGVELGEERIESLEDLERAFEGITERLIELISKELESE
jgi:hypothetical protein